MSDDVRDTRVEALEALAALRRKIMAEADLPQVLTVRQIVAVTGLSEYSVRYRIDNGLLQSGQVAKHATRYVPIEAVEHLCDRLMIVPDWERLVD